MSRVLVLYHSQEFGNTGAMAQAVAEGARDSGADVELVNTNEHRLDIDAYRAFDAVAFGSPDYYSYIAGGLKVFLDDWYIAKQSDATGLTGKPFGLFYSHGGGGKVRQVLESLLERMGSKVGDTIESNGKPGAKVVKDCHGIGTALAEAAAKA